MGFDIFAIFQSIQASNAHAKKILDALKELRETEALVGIPEEESDRPSDSTVTNVGLMYIHSNGSPLAGIPARPVIEPAITNSKGQISAILGDAAKCAAAGDSGAALNQLKKAGLAGQRAAQSWFTDPQNGWAPNGPMTIEAKRKKGGTSPRPLIDTEELRKSITYVLRKKA